MENYDKPNLFGAIKPYLFLFFAFSFQSDIKLRNDIINIFAYSLLALSITIIILLTLFTLDLVPFEVLYSFGDQNVLYSIGDRSYGAFSINRVYFHSSPMLVFSLCYFLNEFFDQKRKVFLCMALVTSVSLFISGTRNNMIMSILPYIVMFYINGNKKIKKCVIAFSIIGFVYLLSQEVVLALFDKTETSNDTKLGMFANYDVAFSNIRTLLLGDGLDSYFYTERGRVNNTELTYFELLRRFGLWGTIAYIFLMFKPAWGLLHRKDCRWLGLSYLLYLVMIISNPFFFSSNGMVILSIVLVSYYNKVLGRLQTNPTHQRSLETNVERNGEVLLQEKTQITTRSG